MKYIVSAAAAAALFVSACGSRTSDTGFFQDGARSAGPLYLCAMQPDPAGAEAEGGQGWVELKVADQAGLSGVWRIFGKGPAGTAVQLISSAEFAAESWSLQNGAVIRLHPREAYSGDDDSGSFSYGYDGKYDFVCGTDLSPVSLPASEEGCVWIEDGEGNITDILFYGTRADPEMTASAASYGEWPSGEGAVPCAGASGYLRLADPSVEGEGPLDWSVCAEPSFMLEPHVSVSGPAASPASVFGGQTMTFSVRAEGFDGASVSSVGFDFSSVVFDEPHQADAVCRTANEGADHLYSVSLDTAGIVPGSYEIPVTVNCVAAPNYSVKLAFTVKGKPVITPGSPSYSFAPSTCAAPGSMFTLSVPSSSSGTSVSTMRLVCAELGIDASAVPGDDGTAVFTVDTAGFGEGSYALTVSASGADAEDALICVPLDLRSDRCLPGGDMESAVEDSSGLKPAGSGYVNASDASDKVFEGERSLHVSGASSSNGFVLSSGSACFPKGGFSKIVFRLKGTSGKSLSINVRTGTTSYRVFNLGTVTADKTVGSSGSNSYTGTIGAAVWVKISLDLSDVDPSGTIAFKFGSAAQYDLYVDDIRYE